MPSQRGDRILYNLKSEIKRKINNGNIETGKILITNGKKTEEFEAETLPRTDILEDIFGESQSLQYTLFLNGQKTRKGLIPLEDEDFEETEDLPTPQGGESQDFSKIIKSQNDFLQQILTQQEILTQQKIDSMVAIYNTKIQSLEDNFKKTLDSREEIFGMKLDLEKEKVKLEYSTGQESILADTIQKVSDEVVPLLGDLLKLWIESKNSVNPKIKNMVDSL
jgi:hypothetical protein